MDRGLTALLRELEDLNKGVRKDLLNCIDVYKILKQLINKYSKNAH